MNFGPIEFADYLRRRQSRGGESAAVKAARDAAPVPPLERNRLSVVSGPQELTQSVRNAVLTVGVFEAIAGNINCEAGESLRVRVRASAGPVVLVLSSLPGGRWTVQRT